MKALVWSGVNRVSVEDVPDPTLLDPGDAILRVLASSVCGSDLHLLGGYVPAMRSGDIIGHEFLGEVVEVGPDVRRLSPGDRVVVGSIIGCGQCRYCKGDLWSLCDNANPQPLPTEAVYGYTPGAIFGYSQAFGGFAGSHAEYIRVPFADHGGFTVPEGLTDLEAVFASDAVPTGWQGADVAGIQPGDTVAVWGAGGVGQMAARAAQLLGAARVVVVDRIAERLRQTEQHIGAEVLNCDDVDVVDALREMTAGRGPRVCIEAVGMEAQSTGVEEIYDRAKQMLRLQSDRAGALRQAIVACGKGGTVSVLGVFGGFVDKVPLGAAMNKGLTFKLGQQHPQRYVPELLQRMARGEITTRHLATHPMPLAEGAEGYRLFKEKDDGCVRAVFLPHG